MLNRCKYGILGTLCGLLLIARPGHTADELTSPAGAGWRWTGSVGLVDWAGLENLGPINGGGFDSTGYTVELTGHRLVTEWGAADILVGADFGLFYTESDIPGFSTSLSQRGLYLTPSMILRFGERSTRYLNLGAGLGWYGVDFAEIQCDQGCIEFAEHFETNAVGGYLGIGGGFGRWFIVGLKVHYADFGPVTVFGPDAGDLSGPIYTFSLGAAFGDR